MKLGIIDVTLLFYSKQVHRPKYIYMYIQICVWFVHVLSLVPFLTDVSANTATQILTSQRPRKYFCHFHDEKVESQIITICRLLGYFGKYV